MQHIYKEGLWHCSARMCLPMGSSMFSQGCPRTDALGTILTQTQCCLRARGRQWCSCCMQAATENGQDETHVAVGPKRKKRAWEEDSDEGPDSEDEREKQRQEDQREKEEFEQRLRDRDEAKTRKLMEAKLSAEEIEVRPGLQQRHDQQPCLQKATDCR